MCLNRQRYCCLDSDYLDWLVSPARPAGDDFLLFCTEFGRFIIHKSACRNSLLIASACLCRHVQDPNRVWTFRTSFNVAQRHCVPLNVKI